MNQISDNKHARMMSKLDQLFWDLSPQRTIDPEIIEYMSTVNFDTLNGLDRVKFFCFKMEIDRCRFQMRNQTLFRLRQGQSHRLQCIICWKDYEPSTAVLLLQCGHTACSSCIDEIYNTVEVKNLCGKCRTPLGARVSLMPLFFKFNYFLDPICRFCDGPYNDDNGCYAYECGHAYHTKCLGSNKIACIACYRPTLTKPTKVYLDFE